MKWLFSLLVLFCGTATAAPPSVTTDEFVEFYNIVVRLSDYTYAQNGFKVGESQFKGILKHPVYAIGGETTGTALKMKDEYVELDFEGNEDMKYIARTFNNNQVVVTGKLTKKEGVEIRERRIVSVVSIADTWAVEHKKPYLDLVNKKGSRENYLVEKYCAMDNECHKQLTSYGVKLGCKEPEKNLLNNAFDEFTKGYDLKVYGETTSFYILYGNYKRINWCCELCAARNYLNRHPELYDFVKSIKEGVDTKYLRIPYRRQIEILGDCPSNFTKHLSWYLIVEDAKRR